MVEVPICARAATEATQRASGDGAQTFPEFLPDGRRFLYLGGGAFETRGVYIGSLDAPDTHRLLDAESAAVYAPQGYLVYARLDQLFAVPWRPSDQEMGSAPPIALNVFLYAVVPKGFFPQQDTGFLNGNVQGAQDLSFQGMRGKLGEFVRVVTLDPAVEDVVAFTGGGGSSNTARMFVTLRPPSERKATADQVIARLRGKLGHVPGAALFLQSAQDVRVGGRAGNAQYQYTLQADNLADLQRWSQVVLGRLRTLPQIVDVNSDQQARGLVATVAIDRDLASRLGVSATAVDDALYDAFGQRQVSTMYTALNQYHVVMEVAPRFWQRPESLRTIYARSSSGAAVPLSAFARFDTSTAPLAVNHQ
jgi:multidrug efflux pump